MSTILEGNLLALVGVVAGYGAEVQNESMERQHVAFRRAELRRVFAGGAQSEINDAQLALHESIMRHTQAKAALRAERAIAMANFARTLESSYDSEEANKAYFG